MTTQQSSQALPSHYVGIGASAGGLEAIEQFFQSVPSEAGLAFIVIQHLSPDYKSMMVELLSKKTQMPVLRAEEGMVVAENTIYLIPPKKNLTIFHGKLLLSDQRPHDRWINLPIDIFFRSLAEDQGDKAVGIILSGTGSDGSRGVRAIKEFGGMIMVQDEHDARFDGMPKSAYSTGMADFVLKATEMPEKLMAYVKYPYLTKTERGEKLVQADEGLTAIFSMLRSKTKVDFTYYKPSTVIRRIERRMNVNQIDDLNAYIVLLKSNNRELTTLYRELLIGVTNFFRDKEAFDYLAESMLPKLLHKKKNGLFRLWVAGCSSGEEAYSLAILLLEIMDKHKLSTRVKIFATDVDNDAVIVAGSGVYPESIAADVGPALLTKYFQRQGDNYNVSRKIREMVVFAQHNLIKDPPFTNIDMVSCRNLLIYLQPVLQKKALDMFNFSLNPGGILFLGTSESTGEMNSYFSAKHHKWKVYESKGKRNLPAERADTSLPFTPRDHYSKSLTPQPYPSRTYTDPNRRLNDRLLKALANDIIPLTIVINEDLEVVYTVGDAGDYFQLPHGRMDNDIRRMVKKEISIPLTIGIQKAFKEYQEVTYSNISFTGDQGKRIIQINIRPLPASRTQSQYLAILFTEAGLPTVENRDVGKETYDYDKETEQRINDLEQELQFTKENLQATIEELETSNEELQATNEELLASNEELQSTNEELQSVNEELYTVNSEHQRKIMELTELNNDIDNLLTSTEIGTIFLDEKLQLRKFTPHIQEVFNIIESDIGRPISHLTHSLLDIDLIEVVNKVIESSQSSDHKVSSTDGRWFYLRILPYNVAPHTFAGVVITLIEISDLVHAETALENSEARLGLAERVAQFASWQWNISTGSMLFSSTLEQLLGYGTRQLSRTYEAFLTCIHPDDRAPVIERVSYAVENGEDYEVVHRIVRPDGEERTVKQVGVASLGPNGKAIRLTGITIDITEEQPESPELPVNHNKKWEKESLQEGCIVIDQQGIIRSINKPVEHLFGYHSSELIGQNVSLLMPSPHREKHDEYITRYLETGEARIIDTGRSLDAVTKDGERIKIQLSIGEIKIGPQSLFAGIIKS